MGQYTCRYCGYDVAGLLNSGESGTCPECGHGFAPLHVREVRLLALRWKVPLYVGLGSMMIALGLIVLLAAGKNAEWAFFNLILSVLAGMTNWIATANAWMQSDRRGMILNQFRTCLIAWSVGLAAGVATIAMIVVIMLATMGMGL